MRITELGRRHGLSRSTLLYYDRIGLLRASGRSAAGYRSYSDADQMRLERICTYRRTGLPLKEIARILDAPKGRVTGALRHRIEELDDEMRTLRQQQALLARLLESGNVPNVEFERSSPDRHGRFLRFLGIDAKEVAEIRSRSRAEFS